MRFRTTSPASPASRPLAARSSARASACSIRGTSRRPRAIAATSAFGATTKTSLASVGQARRTPGVAASAAGEPARRRRWRARPTAAKAHRRDRPPSARRGSAPWTASGRRACAERRSSPRSAGIEKDAPPRRRARRSSSRRSVRTSTPARQVISAGVALAETSALAKRAPSICTPIPFRCAIELSSETSLDAIDRPRFASPGTTTARPAAPT